MNVSCGCCRHSETLCLPLGYSCSSVPFKDFSPSCPTVSFRLSLLQLLTDTILGRCGNPVWPAFNSQAVMNPLSLFTAFSCWSYLSKPPAFNRVFHLLPPIYTSGTTQLCHSYTQTLVLTTLKPCPGWIILSGVIYTVSIGQKLAERTQGWKPFGCQQSSVGKEAAFEFWNDEIDVSRADTSHLFTSHSTRSVISTQSATIIIINYPHYQLFILMCPFMVSPWSSATLMPILCYLFSLSSPPAFSSIGPNWLPCLLLAWMYSWSLSLTDKTSWRVSPCPSPCLWFSSCYGAFWILCLPLGQTVHIL